jgi:hypothetical protein
MNGKTKSFLEDTFISVVIITIIIVLYYVISNFFINENDIVKEENSATIVEHNIEQPTIIVEDINQTQINEQDTIESQNSIDEKIIIENTEKKIDIKKLKEFINDTEEEISKNIVYGSDKNETSKKEYLKIRMTLLKSGDYEQLKFVEGNEDLFEKNKENITKIFPLSIDKDIVEEFPRYLRLELKKKF